ncbi:MAG: hypothetical protein Q9221_005056 [Calogaya cf. arnoldii]
MPGGLHNPYRISFTPISLDFNSTGPSLDRVNMVRTFSHFRRVALKHMNESETGDAPFPPRFSLGVQSVRLELRRRPYEKGKPQLTWGIALEVTRGVNLKMHTEGFKARTCIVRTGGDKEIVVGFVEVGPSSS